MLLLILIKSMSNSALKKGLFCYKNLLSLVNSAIKENNINMVLSLSVMDLSVLRRFSTKYYRRELVFLSKLSSDELAER